MPANNNRFTKRNCPITSAFVAEFRQIFGEDQVKIIAVKERDVDIDTRRDDDTTKAD